MSFRASFCDPFKRDIIEIGSIDKGKIIETFEKIPWDELLQKMKSANEKDIYYSPSLEIENTGNKNGVTVSAIDGTEWYIFFKRPKLRKKFFGLMKEMDNDYMTDVTGQTETDVRDCLTALIENNLQFLEDKIR